MELNERWELLSKQLYDYAIELLGEPSSEESKESCEEFFKLTYNTSTKKWICHGELDCMIDVYAESETMEKALKDAFDQFELNLKKQKEKLRKGELKSANETKEKL